MPGIVWTLNENSFNVKAKICGALLSIAVEDGFAFLLFDNNEGAYLNALESLNLLNMMMECGRQEGHSKDELKDFEDFIETYSETLDTYGFCKRVG